MYLGNKNNGEMLQNVVTSLEKKFKKLHSFP
jgi:hypothetical protein